MGSQIEQQGKMAEALLYRTLGSTAENPYVLALDVGTTTVRCHVYDKHAQIKGSGLRKVICLHICSVVTYRNYYF